jgi:membrane-bound lytic murein transglycosylase MltF
MLFYSNFSRFLTLKTGLLTLGILVLSPSTLAQNQTQTTSLSERIQKPFIGDLDEIRQRRILRVLVNHSRTNFFETQKGKRGLEYDLLKAYESYLNRGPRQERYQTHLVFLVRPFEQLFAELLAGKGDLIASGLTITPERKALVDFTDPYIENVNEILVAHKDAPEIERLEDLAGQQIIAVANSSYIIHLEMFNQFLGLHGLQPFEIIKADPLLEAEDILEMVNAGLYPYTLVDNHIAEIYQQTLSDLKVHQNLIFHHGGQIAWAINPNLPQLKASLNAFINSYAKPGRFLGNSVYQKYFENAYWIKQPELLSELENIECLTYYLQIYANFYDFDWFLIAAQAYQESKFNQHLTSHAGATGIMQIKPSTAHSKNVAIKNIDKLENNIHAGVKYLAFIRDTYFSGPQYSTEDRINFSLAAYNAGPGRVRKMQRDAQKLGLNPNKWFYNVEVVARNTIGHETVNYVANIQKTKIALKTYKTLSDNKRLLKTQQIESRLEALQSQNAGNQSGQSTPNPPQNDS